MALRSALRSLLLGFLIPVFVRRTFDQCRRFESAFSSENAAGKWRRHMGKSGTIKTDFDRHDGITCTCTVEPAMLCSHVTGSHGQGIE